MLRPLFLNHYGHLWRRKKTLRLAITNFKIRKPSDETGLTAELLKAAEEEFFVRILEVFHFVLERAHYGAFLKHGNPLFS